MRWRPRGRRISRRCAGASTQKTKPRGSLGRLEDLAVRVAAAGGRLDALDPVIVVVAGDHGVARRGVSAYPQEVTRQMLAAFTGGDAAVCVLARQAGADLVVVDAGVVEPVDDPAVLDLRQGPGTADFTTGPAMTRRQAEAALAAGVELADELVRDHGLVALGEMGIGNSTAAAAVAAALLECGPQATCGRGTGLDDAGLAHKLAVVEAGLRLHHPDPADPVGVLAAVGGFELAVLAGLALGVASHEVPVVIDGFISSTSALAAARLAPALAGPARCLAPFAGAGAHARPGRARPRADARPRHAARRGLGRRAVPAAHPLVARDPRGDGDVRGRRRHRCGPLTPPRRRSRS